MIKVTAGIIELDNKILIARRKKDKHLAGFWEFPGGKIEEGESPEYCLKRELFEELNLEVVVGSFFMDSIYKYKENTILLKSYKCSVSTKEITLNYHDKALWINTSQLADYKFAPADISFVYALLNEGKFNSTVYDIKSFLEVEISLWGERLKQHVKGCMGEKVGYSQRKAWFDSFNILREQLSKLTNVDNAKIIFEYELPRERGRRPDVLILSGDNLLVLEFKGYSNENKAHIDQAKHYARDLVNYHEKSHKLNVIPFLVLASARGVNKQVNSVHVISGDLIHKVLWEYINNDYPNVREWFHSAYAPLPNLIQSAQLLFKEGRFPQIKKASSAGIPDVLNELKTIVLKAKENNSHHLVLVSGVPGAGKTLVGIQFVFESDIQGLEQKAVLLSGNGPLASVLQKSLGNKNFVQGVHGFLKEYAHSTLMPAEDVFIYDEAQRAWDSEKVTSSNRKGNNSEPSDFVAIASRKEHCIIVGLIGDGQEIHLGEESGLSLWSEAIKDSNKKWNVHCPTKYASFFNDFSLEVKERFNLTTSLRTHQALALQNWVAALLDNNIAVLQKYSNILKKEEYTIYITRNLDTAKHYLVDKYKGEEDKTYGIIASSKSKILPKYGVKNDFNSTKKFTAAEYYVEKESAAYCRKMNTVVTEFACQGLELDTPIVAWDTDFTYNDKWCDNLPNSKAKNSFELRKNSYRVLLTRGRDGMIIFMPSDAKLNRTHDFLKDNGCEVLV